MADYTGVSFGGVHSYEDWGLRLKNVTIEMPMVKSYYLDVPGMHGQLDLTEAMQDGVKYDMRTLTFVFDARHASYNRWAGLISVIAEAIEGKEMQIIQDIDSGYYYVGRPHISTEKTNEVLAEITIECYCEPYKRAVSTSDEPWLWDPFSFIDGVAMSTADIAIKTSGSAWQEVELQCYPWNDTLTIVSNAKITMKYKNEEYELVAGTNVLYTLELEEGLQTLYFQGTGTITIVHRGGRL